MRYVVFTLLLFITLSTKAYEDRNLLQKAADIDKLKESLILNQGWVTYPGYSDRKNWNLIFGTDRDFYIKQGEKYLNYDWKVVKATDYLSFARSGNRKQMEELHNSNIIAINSLFMAEMAEGKGRFMDQLANGIFHVCEMTTWSISAHLPLQQVKGSFPKLNDHVIELVSSDIGASFSWIYYFLHEELDKITPLISERILYEIDNRIMTPYLNGTRFWWMATNVTAEKGFVNNWNPWCNANVVQCFLLLEKDKERLAKAVYTSMISVDKFINYNNEDGACEEGPSYWGHAAGKMYDYLQLIYDATRGNISIFAEPIIKNMGEYITKSYVGNGWVVNFADASAKSSFDHKLIYRYGNMVHSPEMIEFASYWDKNYFKENLSITRDIFRMLSDLSTYKALDQVNPAHSPNSTTWYSETEFCYMISSNLFFAAKGGYNDESHNHNDVGTFSLYANNSPVIIDVGVGTYTEKTFSSDRYSIWTMQSDYHNVPRINGYSQSYGRNFRSSDVKIDKEKKRFSLDISKSYPADTHINKWVRSYKLQENSLTIEDDYDITNAKIANQLNFMTWGDVIKSEDGIICITILDKKYELTFNKNDLEASIEQIMIDDARLSTVWGDKVFRISLEAKKVTNKGKYKIIIKY